MKAQRFLHADTGGFHLSTARKMLPIRQNINRLTALNRTLRAVLVEVCGLAENGKHGAFTGSNEGLSQNVGGTPRTITRTLAELQRLGLLTIEGATKLRRITCTPRLRACYTGSGPEQFAAIEALNSALSIDKMSKVSIDKTEMSIDNQGTDSSHSGSLSLDIQGSVYKETSNSNQYNQEEKEEALRSSLAAAEKKIVQLQNEKEQLAAEGRRQEKIIEQLRASLLGIRPNASASHTGAAAPHLGKLAFAQSKFATSEGFQDLARRLGYPAAYAPHYLAHMAVKAEAMEPRDERGWQNFAQRFLANDANSETGIITTPPKDSAHATANHFGRSRSGFHSKDLDFSEILTANAYLASASGHSGVCQPSTEPDSAESFAVEFDSEA